MKKDELLLLLDKIKANNLVVDISKLLTIDNQIVAILIKINDKNIFTNAYLIADVEIDNKLFVIRSMLQVKDPFVTDVIYAQASINSSDKEIIKLLSECENAELAKAYRLLLNNKTFTKFSNYREVLELLKDEKEAWKIKLINSLLFNNHTTNDCLEIIKLIKRCKDENIAFLTYKLTIDDNLKKNIFFKEMIEKMVLSKNKEMALALYQVITDKNMQARSDYKDIIDKLFNALLNEEYYEITDIDSLIATFIQNNNIVELKEKLRFVPSNQEVVPKMLVLVLK